MGPYETAKTPGPYLDLLDCQEATTRQLLASAPCFAVSGYVAPDHDDKPVSSVQCIFEVQSAMLPPRRKFLIQPPIFLVRFLPLNGPCLLCGSTAATKVSLCDAWPGWPANASGFLADRLLRIRLSQFLLGLQDSGGKEPHVGRFDDDYSGHVSHEAP